MATSIISLTGFDVSIHNNSERRRGSAATRAKGLIPGRMCWWVEWIGPRWGCRPLLPERSGSVLGGHFLEGRCSVVLAYDYLQGRDFGELHVSWCTRMEAVSAENGEAVSPALGQLRPEQIDFRRYSRHLNPEKPSYDFRVDAVQEHKSGASLESQWWG